MNWLIKLFKEDHLFHLCWKSEDQTTQKAVQEPEAVSEAVPLAKEEAGKQLEKEDASNFEGLPFKKTQALRAERK